jgi:hypothetical protein
VSKLRARRHENPELQRDWDRDGEQNFIWVDVLLRAGYMRPHLLEDLLIDTLRTMDPTLGYNRMTSRGWSQHARLRDLERKLIRGRKFKLIPGVKLGDAIDERYLESVWKGHGRVKDEQPEETDCEEDLEAAEENGTEVKPGSDADEPADGEDRPEDD